MVKLPSDEDILKEFNDFENDFFDSPGWKWWMSNEVKDSYAILEGLSRGEHGHWEEKEMDKRIHDEMPVFVINKVAPVVDAICGFQVQNRTEIEYLPRTLEQPDRAGNDLINNGVDYLRQDSGIEGENSWAFKDMLSTGIGAVDLLISHNENPVGEMEGARTAPYLCMWDPAARKKNLVDANRVASGVLVDKEKFLEEINEDRPKSKKIASLGGGSSRFLEIFDFIDSYKNRLTVAWTYQWRKKMPVHLVENTIRDPEILQLLQERGDLEKITSKFGSDITKDEILIIEPSKLKDLKLLFEAVNAPFKSTRHRTYKYFRAIIVDGNLISKAENFSQDRFSLQFLTGKWSEIRQCWYGVLRGGKDPQRLLNKAVPDVSEYLFSTPHGGLLFEESAVDDVAEFVQYYTKARFATVVRDGAIQRGKIQQKQQQALPAGSFATIDFASQAIMEAMGVTLEFMGQADGNVQQAALLQAQRVRQGLTVLVFIINLIKTT